jgi:hypothetical protein
MREWQEEILDNGIIAKFGDSKTREQQTFTI